MKIKKLLLTAFCAVLSVGAWADTDVTASYIGDLGAIVNGGGHNHVQGTDNHKMTNGIGWYNTQALPSGWHAFAAPGSNGTGESFTFGIGGAGVMMGRTIVLPAGQYTLTYKAFGATSGNATDATASAANDVKAFCTDNTDVDITNTTVGGNTFHDVSFNINIIAPTKIEFGIKKLAANSKSNWCQIKDVKLVLKSGFEAVPNNSIDGWTREPASPAVGNFEVNTWSKEGQSDGTAFQVPFIQTWVASGSQLSDVVIKKSYNPSQTGRYKVTAWVRPKKENGGDISGVSMFAGAREVNVKSTRNYTVYISATANTPFDYGFKLTNTTINWLSFKNVTIEYVGAESNDYTSAIINPSFENGLTGWTNSGMGTQTNSSITKEGNTYAEVWQPNGTKSIEQKITGLPTGQYKLTVHGRTRHTKSAYIYINNVRKDFDIDDSEKDYELYTMIGDNCDITIGAKTVGTGAGSSWFAVDNFRLTYISDQFLELPEAASGKMNAEIAQAQTDAFATYNSNKTADNFDAAWKAINDAKESVSKYALVEPYNTKAAALDAAGQAAYAPTLAAYNDGRLIKNGEEAQAKAAYVAAVKAQTTEGADMTDAIANPCPESETHNANGWTINTTAGNKPFVHGQYFEHYSTDATNAFDYYQVINGLPSGAYTISADMWAEQLFDGKTASDIDGTLGVYGKSRAEAQASATTEGKNSKTTAEIHVTNGTLRIGVKNFATRVTKWFHADNFQLTYVRALTAEETEIYAKEDALVAANEVKTAWAGKVGGVFQHTTEAYDAVVAIIDNAEATSTQINDAITAFNNSKVEPNANKYYRMYLAQDGESTGLNLNVLKGKNKILTVSSAPYAVKIVPITNGYNIQSVYGSNIAFEQSDNTVWGTADGLSAARGDRFTSSLNNNGTIILTSAYGDLSIGANGFTEGSAVGRNSNTQWIIEEAEVTEVTMVCGENVYATFCAPYDVILPAGVTAYSASIGENVVNLTSSVEENDVLAAGTPVLIQSTSGINNTFRGIINVTEDADANSVLKGIYTAEQKNIDAGNYVLNTQNNLQAFYVVGQKGLVGTLYRCYLAAPVNEARLTINIDGEETGINDLETENGTIADGKYMQNNKVVIVKNGRKYNVTGQIVK